eukprot:CAMPEP_0115090828 /NCGR_PEP_ID=MMETSP0227-20121206/25696_1 /TAXON_ID=89957 /ORGANISM="Polarella glacialis, Strain CCMP 1383" /LENGTH=836 /DNA_ID=CAMNT_0002482117 /DNA_START=47 /DNA_END=2557 /DNA_ORIENTATION=-
MAAPRNDYAGGLPDITQDEVSRLTKAMKQQQFRDHIDEYTREISDPANRKEYLTYLDQLEAKGEMPDGQGLLRCQPGLCVKTSISFKNGQLQKCFINIVHSDRLDDLSLVPATGGGNQAHLPYSLSPPRPDRDHKDEYCMTCDFAVSTGTFMRAASNAQILKMIVDTAADGLATQYLKGHEEVKKDFKVMQRMNCKGGFPMPMSVEAELLKKGKPEPPRKVTGQDAVTPAELKEMRRIADEKRTKLSGVPDAEEEEKEDVRAIREAAAALKAKEQESGRIRVPQHRLVHSGTMNLTDFMEVDHRPNPNAVTTVPRILKLVVELPTVKKSSDIVMEVTRDNVVVEVEGKYYLDLPLPYEVDEARGNAAFDKTKQTLTLDLPVIPKLPDPEMQLRAGGFSGSTPVDDDGAVSEGDDELLPLEEEREPPPPEVAAVVPPAPAPPAAPPAAAEKKRELLELEPSGSSLRTIVQPEPEESEERPLGGVELQEEEDEPQAKFVAAGSFEGAKLGYYFGTGEEGLGYYKDLRQSRRKATGTRAIETRHSLQLVTPGFSQQLVTEMEEPAPPASIELPAYAQAYVEATAALSSRFAPEEVDATGEATLEVNCRVGRQNLLLRIGVPGSQDEEVADLRLALVGRRLTLSFCSRSSSSGSQCRWRRHCLRRTLGGALDPRQWHAEVSPASGSMVSAPSQRRELHIVLRKAVSGEVWDSAFLTGGSVASQASAALADEPALAGGPVGDDAKLEADALGLTASTGKQGADDSAEASTGDLQETEPEVVEDSAELDAEAPVVHDMTIQGAAAAQNRGSVNSEFSASVVQSATVMGQGVILRTRLMYQLL